MPQSEQSSASEEAAITWSRIDGIEQLACVPQDRSEWRSLAEHWSEMDHHDPVNDHPTVDESTPLDAKSVTIVQKDPAFNTPPTSSLKRAREYSWPGKMRALPGQQRQILAKLWLISSCVPSKGAPRERRAIEGA